MKPKSPCMKHRSEREGQLGRRRREGKALVMLQVMLGGGGSTPVLINLLMMCLKTERSGIKGESLSKRQGWKCRARGTI